MMHVHVRIVHGGAYDRLPVEVRTRGTSVRVQDIVDALMVKYGEDMTGCTYLGPHCETIGPETDVPTKDADSLTFICSRERKKTDVVFMVDDGTAKVVKVPLFTPSEFKVSTQDLYEAARTACGGASGVLLDLSMNALMPYTTPFVFVPPGKNEFLYNLGRVVEVFDGVTKQDTRIAVDAPHGIVLFDHLLSKLADAGLAGRVVSSYEAPLDLDTGGVDLDALRNRLYLYSPSTIAAKEKPVVFMVEMPDGTTQTTRIMEYGHGISVRRVQQALGLPPHLQLEMAEGDEPRPLFFSWISGHVPRVRLRAVPKPKVPLWIVDVVDGRPHVNRSGSLPAYTAYNNFSRLFAPGQSAYRLLEPRDAIRNDAHVAILPLAGVTARAPVPVVPYEVKPGRDGMFFMNDARGGGTGGKLVFIALHPLLLASEVVKRARKLLTTGQFVITTPDGGLVQKGLKSKYGLEFLGEMPSDANLWTCAHEPDPARFETYKNITIFCIRPMH